MKIELTTSSARQNFQSRLDPGTFSLQNFHSLSSAHFSVFDPWCVVRGLSVGSVCSVCRRACHPLLVTFRSLTLIWPVTPLPSPGRERADRARRAAASRHAKAATVVAAEGRAADLADERAERETRRAGASRRRGQGGSRRGGPRRQARGRAGKARSVTRWGVAQAKGGRHGEPRCGARGRADGARRGAALRRRGRGGDRELRMEAEAAAAKGRAAAEGDVLWLKAPARFGRSTYDNRCN